MRNQNVQSHRGEEFMGKSGQLSVATAKFREEGGRCKMWPREGFECHTKRFKVNTSIIRSIRDFKK